MVRFGDGSLIGRREARYLLGEWGHLRDEFIAFLVVDDVARHFRHRAQHCFAVATKVLSGHLKAI
jgi:hypothetical protein